MYHSFMLMVQCYQSDELYLDTFHLKFDFDKFSTTIDREVVVIYYLLTAFSHCVRV
jgi:hypothetical protein